ncbi:MAG: VWA domain-containing protein [Anaerolineae bacterium]|nr:VWA domain-containing protein [Anaerolineae bacterium]
MDDKHDSLIISVAGREIKPVVRPAVTVAGKPIEVQVRRAVDLVFVIDTTGSMSDKIQGLLHACERFVHEFAALALDYRMAVVAFGDLTVTGDKITCTNFTATVEGIVARLRKIPRYGGGGNEGESSLEALQKAMGLPFRQDAVKALILATDEPALQHNTSAQSVTGQLAQQEFLTFVVSPDLDYYRDMARSTGGSWYRISAQTDLTAALDTFRRIASQVSQVVSDVYQLGAGSVAEYRKLAAPRTGDGI